MWLYIPFCPRIYLTVRATFYRNSFQLKSPEEIEAIQQQYRDEAEAERIKAEERREEMRIRREEKQRQREETMREETDSGAKDEL